jgi:hypothetical protein
MTEVHPPSRLPISYWVIPGRLLAGEYPFSHRDVEARGRLHALLDAGIRSFVDLTESADGLRAYGAVILELAAARGLDIHYRQMSIRDLDIPTVDHMELILQHIEDELAAGYPLYVHCWGGIGRTGTVVGCWMCEKDGRSADEAFARIAQLRAGTRDVDIPSPQTLQQREFVTKWKRRGADDHRARGRRYRRRTPSQ